MNIPNAKKKRAFMKRSNACIINMVDDKVINVQEPNDSESSAAGSISD